MLEAYFDGMLLLWMQCRRMWEACFDVRDGERKREGERHGLTCEKHVLMCGMHAGLTEEWDATIEMMETMLPTYFEGFHANITTDGTCSSSSHVCRVCLCLLLVSLNV